MFSPAAFLSDESSYHIYLLIVMKDLLSAPGNCYVGLRNWKSYKIEEQEGLNV